MRSRIRKKEKTIVPSRSGKRFHKNGKSDRGVLVRPVYDIIDSAGSLSRFATADEMIRELLESRNKPFR